MFTKVLGELWNCGTVFYCLPGSVKALLPYILTYTATYMHTSIHTYTSNHKYTHTHTNTHTFVKSIVLSQRMAPLPGWIA